MGIATHSPVERLTGNKITNHSLPITRDGRTFPVALERVIPIARHNSIQFADRKVERDPKPEVRIRCIAELLAPAADRLKHSTRKECPRLRHIHHAAEV